MLSGFFVIPSACNLKLYVSRRPPALTSGCCTVRFCAGDSGLDKNPGVLKPVIAAMAPALPSHRARCNGPYRLLRRRWWFSAVAGIGACFGKVRVGWPPLVSAVTRTSCVRCSLRAITCCMCDS